MSHLTDFYFTVDCVFSGVCEILKSSRHRPLHRGPRSSPRSHRRRPHKRMFTVESAR